MWYFALRESENENRIAIQICRFQYLLGQPKIPKCMTKPETVHLHYNVLGENIYFKNPNILILESKNNMLSE